MLINLGVAQWYREWYLRCNFKCENICQNDAPSHMLHFIFYILVVLWGPNGAYAFYLKAVLWLKDSKSDWWSSRVSKELLRWECTQTVVTGSRIIIVWQWGWKQWRLKGASWKMSLSLVCMLFRLDENLWWLYPEMVWRGDGLLKQAGLHRFRPCAAGSQMCEIFGVPHRFQAAIPVVAIPEPS